MDSVIVPSAIVLKKLAGQFSWWKGLEYFYTNSISEVKAKLRDGEIVLTGKAAGSKKKDYDLELFVPQDEEELKTDGWTGTCTCENSSKKKNVCSHQVAIILEWDDQRKLKAGIIKKSEKEYFKRTKTIQSTFTKQQGAQFKKKKQEISASTTDKMKSMLKFNDQISTGNKPELIARVAETMVLGGVPRCPECGGGRPKFQNGYYYCPGFMDDTKFLNCDWMSKEIERVPWKYEEDT